MDKKNLMPEATQPANLITIQNLPTEFAELSDKDLQQIVGGKQGPNRLGNAGSTLGSDKKFD